MSKRPHQHIKSQHAAKVLDAYACFFCNKVELANHGHHIILFSEAGAASVDNMITLCAECHRAYHSGKLKIDIGRF